MVALTPGVTLIVTVAMLGGCTSSRPNPSFPVTVGDAHSALRQMCAEPKPLSRPVVVLGGYHDPGLGPLAWGSEVRKWTRGAKVVELQFLTARDFDECRRRVIAAVDRACPTDDPDATVEVDVIGASMGGLVGRYAAVTKPGERRLRVTRLFTVSSPHRGSSWAMSVPALTRLHKDMRDGSDFYRKLENAEAATPVDDYQLVPYVRLGDRIVGAAHAAPAGRTAWWLPDRPMDLLAHFAANTDPRVRADIARRLRGETPFTQEPASPLPRG